MTYLSSMLSEEENLDPKEQEMNEKSLKSVVEPPRRSWLL